MTHFIVTFRFKTDDTYTDRYNSFVNRVHVLGGGAPYVWEETSSFIAFRAEGTASSVATDLYLTTKFNHLLDHMVVIDLDNRKKATHGTIKYEPMLVACLGF